MRFCTQKLWTLARSLPIFKEETVVELNRRISACTVGDHSSLCMAVKMGGNDLDTDTVRILAPT